jgi:hypothetical protein
MSEQRSSFDCLSLFPHEPEIWDGLDEPTREKVLDCLSLLLLQHLQATACLAAEERPFADGCQV